MRNIDFGLIDMGQLFYSEKGFKNITCPWKIPSKICESVSGHEKDYIGSAEQSLYFLYSEGKLLDNKLYQSTTPCFRYEDKLDDLHCHEFIKTELIIFNPIKFNLQNMVDTAFEFFNSFTDKVNIVEIGNTYDIEINGIEVGSYYDKTIKGVNYICGTGLALPRMQEALKLGYANIPIKKQKIGTINKIEEECREYIDALKQNNPIMSLVELSDLLGAINEYSNKFNLSLYDLLEMSMVTKRAFNEGTRF